MQVQSHGLSQSVAPGEQSHRLVHHGYALPSGQKFPHTDPCDAWAGAAFATLCHMARRLNARCLKLVGRQSGFALDPLTFVTGWIWLLSRADLHGDEGGRQSPPTPGFRHTSAHVRALVKAASHREKEKGRKLVEASGLICGARGRNRTGTPCGGGF